MEQIKKLFPPLFRQLLPARGLFLLLAYTGIFFISLTLSYLLRFDFNVPFEYWGLYQDNLLWIIPLKLVLLFVFGQFGGLLSYFRLPDLYRLLTALGLSALFLVYLRYFSIPSQCPPRSVILADFVFSFLLIGGFRVALRVYRERFLTGSLSRPESVKKVAIIGAGDVGAGVAADLLSRRSMGLRPVIFLDDNREKWKKHVHGIPVVDSPDSLSFVKKKYGIQSIIIAMPSASVKRIREVIENARHQDIEAQIVPSLSELTTGQVQPSRIRPVDIQDLLGREPVDLDSENICRMIQGKVVLVTGAGGSIGSELALQIAANNPARLLLVEQSEIQIFEAEHRLNQNGYSGMVLPLIGNILDGKRMRSVFAKYRPHLVFHAAAHKHVPIMECHPGESIKNNSIGTARLADLASEFGVERFVFISTDKAINPTSVMGATKRLGEIYLQSKQKEPKNKTRFMAVRFGNVLGSSGSVVPVFRRQIAEGGPVTVTHPEVTRYFMIIPEAVGLVLQCATQENGGEIFVLDMGEPVKIAELARQMIRLSGFDPETDIEIKYIGLRPGEKLYEEVRHRDEKHVETQHPHILRFISEPMSHAEVRQNFDALANGLDGLERNQIKEFLNRLVPEYSPFLE